MTWITLYFFFFLTYSILHTCCIQKRLRKFDKELPAPSQIVGHRGPTEPGPFCFRFVSEPHHRWCWCRPPGSAWPGKQHLKLLSPFVDLWRVPQNHCFSCKKMIDFDRCDWCWLILIDFDDQSMFNSLILMILWTPQMCKNTRLRKHPPLVSLSHQLGLLWSCSRYKIAPATFQ